MNVVDHCSVLSPVIMKFSPFFPSPRSSSCNRWGIVQFSSKVKFPAGIGFQGRQAWNFVPPCSTIVPYLAQLIMVVFQAQPPPPPSCSTRSSQSGMRKERSVPLFQILQLLHDDPAVFRFNQSSQIFLMQYKISNN